MRGEDQDFSENPVYCNIKVIYTFCDDSFFRAKTLSDYFLYILLAGFSRYSNWPVFLNELGIKQYISVNLTLHFKPI